jgi:hypothetical protein
MEDRPPISRRRLIFGLSGLAVATAITHTLVHRRENKPANFYAPLVLSPAVPPLTQKRLQALHGRYDAVAAASGVPAMRARILADIRGFRGHDEWLDAIHDWIQRVGWMDAADLCIDVAEIAGMNIRRNCAASLSQFGTPLLSSSLHGSRIVRLHMSESDGAARSYWGDLRARLGV